MNMVNKTIQQKIISLGKTREVVCDFNYFNLLVMIITDKKYYKLINNYINKRKKEKKLITLSD